MPLIPDAATIQKSFAMLPVSTYEPGEMVIAAGATTGKLLFLRQGEVEVVRDGTQIATISEPGSVFGDLAVLLDKPHTADVRALEHSEFNVADAATLLGAIRRPRSISRQSLPVGLTPQIARSSISSASSKPASLEPRSPER